MSTNYQLELQTNSRLTNQVVLCTQLPFARKTSHQKFSPSDMATDTDAEGLTLAPHKLGHLRDYRNKHLRFETPVLYPSSAITANCKGN